MPDSLLIDNNGARILKRVPTIVQGLYWAELLIPNSDFSLRAVSKGSLERYTLEEQASMFKYLTSHKEAPSNQCGKLTFDLFKLVKEIPKDNTTLEDLEKKLGHSLPVVTTKPAPEPEGRRRVEASSKISRPGKGTATGKVWDIADSLVIDGELPEKLAVVSKCVEQGIHPSTAGVQFSKWKRYISEQK